LWEGDHFIKSAPQLMQNLFRLRRSLVCSSSLQHFAGMAAFTI